MRALTLDEVGFVSGGWNVVIVTAPRGGSGLGLDGGGSAGGGGYLGIGRLGGTAFGAFLEDVIQDAKNAAKESYDKADEFADGLINKVVTGDATITFKDAGKHFAGRAFGIRAKTGEKYVIQDFNNDGKWDRVYVRDLQGNNWRLGKGGFFDKDGWQELN